jgi:hypothetical protein
MLASIVLAGLGFLEPGLTLFVIVPAFLLSTAGFLIGVVASGKKLGNQLVIDWNILTVNSAITATATLAMMAIIWLLQGLGIITLEILPVPT